MPYRHLPLIQFPKLWAGEKRAQTFSKKIRKGKLKSKSRRKSRKIGAFLFGATNNVTDELEKAR